VVFLLSATAFASAKSSSGSSRVVFIWVIVWVYGQLSRFPVFSAGACFAVEIGCLFGNGGPTEVFFHPATGGLGHFPAARLVAHQLVDRRRQFPGELVRVNDASVICSTGTSKPVSPCTTTSGMPPTALATTGVPQAIASRLMMPNGS